jgi:ABC-type Zn uptake system ZnuABC Zn-binding protein ZnuA
MKKLHFPPLLTSVFSFVIFLGVAACGVTGSEQPSTQQVFSQASDRKKLKAVATTTIVADIVGQIGGEAIDLTVMLPSGTDPHTFDPTPQDITKVAEADVIFANGAGLEEFLDPLLQSAGASNKIVYVSEGVSLLHFEGLHEGNDLEPHDESADPHTWTDPKNILTWINNIERTLIESDPSNAGLYERNAQRYASEINDLDAWVKAQVEQIPVDSRQIITDHLQFAYFAEAYGFKQLGALISGYSTLAEPSAQELASIEDAIKAYNVPAIFVGKTINPSLANRIATDTGTQIVFLYTGSLTEDGGEADTYLYYIRYNVTAIVNALK